MYTHTVNNTLHVTEIRSTSLIETEHEFQLRLAAWGGVGACEKGVVEGVDESISATFVLAQCEYETDPIEQRLRSIPS